ncbi:monovalent cation:proton antiporter-2 (CPA2) family protein [Antarcticirhabdus aurantiaca]|uniref:Monovalent cation:proton antiporter-2 (CPA2) family protein n=1 Tax=Antarcticirhabdus aurantiaca TaxID=2606717 RepID=A0ACD4NRQ4_9HYPH|nr:monovalent cation:proton antiporter-2 (CPA2) family protein [Antarcticirhabdus aurantiaca]WAJ29482.1 monovalent cation:proton antiporter-2 (CPA2) family protein [Jeongeuplla avenae]
MPSPTPHADSILSDILIFLSAAVIVVPLFRGMRTSPVIGYLLAGVVLGPNALTLIGNAEGAHRLAEFGIVFMLFAIGLEMTMERLKTMARYIFGLGLAQVAVTGTLLGGVAMLAGAAMPTAAVLGGALALSSTAFVLQILSERGELASRTGRVILSVLLLQDLASVPGLALVAALGSPPEELAPALLAAGTKAIAAMLVILAAGRLLLRPLLRMVAGARSPELFAAATLLVVLGTAFATSQAGLPMALGAFLSGLMLAGTEYRHQVEADIRPVRGILLGLFFMSVGMLIDPAFVLARLPEILGLAAGLIAVKALVLALLARLSGLALPQAAHVGLHLAQGGEFAFVLLAIATQQGVVTFEGSQLLIAVVAFSMAATPLLASAGRRAAHALERRAQGHRPIAAAIDPAGGIVLVAGFGRVGRTVAAMLDARGEAWVGLDHDAAMVARARREGQPVVYGDASREAVLHALGSGRFSAAILTMDDPSGSLSIVSTLRRERPDLVIVARAHDAAHRAALLRAGANEAVVELLEASIILGSALLHRTGASGDEVRLIAARLRESATDLA